MADDHVVYMLKCGDGSLYTGYTTDLERRLSDHRNGDGAKYTRGRGPLRVVYTEGFPTRRAAMQREYEIKQYPREEKLALVEDGDQAESASGTPSV